MNKKPDPMSQPHVLPYVVACGVAFGLPILVVLGYAMISGYKDRTFEDNIFIIAIALAPIWWAFGTVVSDERTHRILPFLAQEEVRSRLSNALFIGVLGAMFMLEGVTGIWAVGTQFIGGVMIIGIGFAIYEYAADMLMAGLKRMWQNR